jgi:hypothetical protein
MARKHGFTTWCVVRNHWDTAVSWATSRDGSLDIIAALDCHGGPEDQLWPHAFTADHVLRYENLEQELHDLTGLVLDKRIGVSNRLGDYRLYYDQPTQDYILNRYRTEIMKLGYQF